MTYKQAQAARVCGLIQAGAIFTGIPAAACSTQNLYRLSFKMAGNNLFAPSRRPFATTCRK
jgi:hypothetical protein